MQSHGWSLQAALRLVTANPAAALQVRLPTWRLLHRLHILSNLLLQTRQAVDTTPRVIKEVVMRYEGALGLRMLHSNLLWKKRMSEMGPHECSTI